MVGETDGQAQALAEQYLLPNYTSEYGSWGHPLITSVTTRDGGLAAVAGGRLIIGGPETVIRGIRDDEERFGVNQLIVRQSSATTPHEFIMRQLELFATHVMPAFQST